MGLPGSCKDFRTKRELARTIIVNGQSVVAPRKLLTYEDVVRLAGEVGTPSMMWSIKIGQAKQAGTLMPGGKIKVSAGFVFNVAHTGNA